MTLEERLALNQAIFRVANERMMAWPERGSRPPDEPLSVFCECSHEGCRRKLTVERAEYEAVRCKPRRFLVAPGHDVPRIDRVVDKTGDCAVVEKKEDVAELVARCDPRRFQYRSDEGNTP